MVTQRESIRLFHAALDDENGEIILRGVIDPESIPLLKVGDYQRENIPLNKIENIARAFRSKESIPDIDLGMRGGDYREREGAFYLQNDIFIVDGYQRQTAAVKVLKEGHSPKLGAVIHFNTTEVWEKKRFKTLNLTRTRLSPNVLIRNMRQENEAVSLLYILSNTADFSLYKKVCWEQTMRREQLVGALGFLKVAAALHRSLGTGQASGHEQLAVNLNKTMEKIGRKVVRENVEEFWRFMDRAWGVKVIHYREAAVHLRVGFMTTVAQLMVDHANFWKNSVELEIPLDLERKLSTFPLLDPQIVNLAGSAGASKNILYQLMVEHLNRGKTTRRLVPIRKRKGESIEEVMVVMGQSQSNQAAV